jgi:hypothetical protein
MQERNEALKERDEARRIAAYQYAKHHNGEEETLQNNFFKLNGWNTTNKEPQ